MDVRDALIERAGKKFMRSRTAFERFDNEAAERERVGPRWNVRDLAGHLVFWTGEAAAQAEALARGGAAKQYDLDRINEDVFRKNRRMNYVMLLPHLRQAEERFLGVLRGLPVEQLVGETPLRKWIDEAVFEHYDHHWPGLAEAVGRLGAD